MSDEPVRRLDLEALRSLTPARIFAGRVGTSYRTETQLDLREDHAEAVDAVHAVLDLRRDLGHEFVDRYNIEEVSTCARSKAEYLLRPDLGRRLDREAIAALETYPKDVDIQIFIGDGLSSTAVVAQVPALLPLLLDRFEGLSLSLGRVFFVRNCRVGVLNDVGRIVCPRVAVLLIGERPGLATAESLSAYLAFRPQPDQTDAHRNLISNIHVRGTLPIEAADRIANLARQMIHLDTSGVSIKEHFK